MTHFKQCHRASCTKKAPHKWRLNAALVCLLAVGCAQPKLFKRYASAQYATAAVDDLHARLAGFVLDERVIEAPEFLLQLGSQGQASFIKAFSDKTSSEQDFTQALARGLIVKPSQSANGDRVRFTKQIVLSIEKTGALGPADRIARIDINLARPANARFVSWDKFTTRYESVELGKVIFKGSDTVDLGTDGSLEEGPVHANARVGFQGKSELSEELTLRQRYVGVTGTLATNSAWILMESIVGIDLAGNTVLDIVIEATPAPAAHQVLTIDQLEPAEKSGQAQISIGRRLVQYPARSTPVTCELGGEYVVRRVTRNAETLLEGDDHVEFVSGKFRSAPIELVSAAELATFVWAIQTAAGEFVFVESIGAAEFASYEEATEFLALVRHADGTVVAGHSLTSGGFAGPKLDAAAARGLQIYTRKIN